MTLWGRKIHAYQWYFIGLIFAIVSIGATTTWYVVFYVNETEKNSLLERTLTIARALEIEEMKRLEGTEEDLQNSSYLHLKKTLQNVLRVNKDTRFIYLTGKKNGEVLFLVDSEDPSSEGYSPPGQVYFEASNEFLAMFENRKNLVEGPVSDRWGTWISALTPIVDEETGKVVAVLGMDVDASNHFRKVVFYAFLPVLITIFLALLALLGQEIMRKEQRLIALRSELMAVTSHDLRAPLIAITWAVETLLSGDYGNMQEDQKTVLQKILGNCHALLKMSNSVLELPSLQEKKATGTKKSAWDLPALLREVIKMLALAAQEKEVKIVLDISAPEKLQVYGDYDKLREVFSNLVSNAIKYSHAKGTVTIGYKQEEGHVVWVKDEGVGIPESAKQKVFEKFYRAKNARKSSAGSGVGLYYAKRIVERYKGEMWFESVEGKGTTFFVRLREKV